VIAVILELKVLLVRWDLKDFKESRALLGPKAFRVLLALRACKER
jgi:hypothetical protein